MRSGPVERFVYYGLLSGVLVAIFSFTAAGDTPLAKRHQTSGLNSHFNFSGDTLADYLAYSRGIISRARVDLDNNSRENIIRANMPFALTPPARCPGSSTKRFQRGILLIHGLTDSPYWLRHLGTYFQQQCFYVLAILLPGHGTRPGDLLDVSWRDWTRAVDFGTDLLQREVEHTWLGGYSTGATLALYQAGRKAGIDGLILISPALRLVSNAAYAHWRQWFGRWWRPALWWQIQPDDDPYKYESFPVNGIVQLYQLTQELQPLLQQPPSLPLLIAASEDDATVDSRATIELFSRWQDRRKKLLWFSRDMQAQDGKLQIIDSRAVDKPSGHPIVSSSHISLLIPASDPQYGAEGRYASCLHYFGEQPQAWRRCKDRKEDILGETTAYFLSQGVVRRLTYNPYFEEMLEQIGRFIDTGVP